VLETFNGIPNLCITCDAPTFTAQRYRDDRATVKMGESHRPLRSA